MTEKPDRAAILSEPAGDRLNEWVAEFVLGLCQHRGGFVDEEPAEESGPLMTRVLMKVYPMVQCADGCGYKTFLAPGMRAVLTFTADYSTDLAAAWEVVDKLKAHGPAVGYSGALGEWFASFWPGQDGPEDCQWAETASLCISRAALLAVLEDEKA